MPKSKKHISKDEENIYREEQELVRDVADESIDDYEEVKTPRTYPSDITPRDFYEYKKMRIVPDAGTDFVGVVDKDIVLANASGSKPNLQHSKFVVETIELVRNTFVKTVIFPAIDDEGRQRKDADGNILFFERNVFEDAFEPVIRMLLSGLKFEWVGSRAMGSDREAKLDSITNIRKELTKKKDTQGRIFGLGGQQ